MWKSWQRRKWIRIHTRRWLYLQTRRLFTEGASPTRPEWCGIDQNELSWTSVLVFSVCVLLPFSASDCLNTFKNIWLKWFLSYSLNFTEKLTTKYLSNILLSFLCITCIVPGYRHNVQIYNSKVVELLKCTTFVHTHYAQIFTIIYTIWKF